MISILAWICAPYYEGFSEMPPGSSLGRCFRCGQAIIIPKKAPKKKVKIWECVSCDIEVKRTVARR